MWHTMHWLVGMERVNSCLMGWPDSLCGMVGSICDAVRLVAVLRVRARMHRRTIVGVNHVARRAAAVAIIARMIVGAGQRQNRIEQARLLQTQKHRIGSQLGAEAAIAQLDVRTAGVFFRIRNADLGRALRRRARTRAKYFQAAKLPSGPADPGAAARPSDRVRSCDGGG